MASGKQLSFQQGEVSSTHHFRSDSVSYAQGLRKLRNKLVRRDGGVSNRPGFRLWVPSEFQYGVDSFLNKCRIRTFIYGDDEYTVVTESDGNHIYRNGVEISEFFYEGANRSGGRLIPPDPSIVRFTPTKDGVFITPSCGFDGTTVVGSFDPETMTANVFLKGNRAYLVQKNEAHLAAYTGTKGFIGSAPFLPVSYLLTATMKDGREVIVLSEQSTGFTFGSGAASSNPGGNVLCYPHVEMSSNISISYANASLIADVKFFNLYRAAGADGVGQSFYKLCSRINNPGDQTDFSFSDYGADDPSQTPPLDMSNFQRGAFVNSRVAFGSGDVALYYQQRLMVTGEFMPEIEPGEILCSALGAPRQLAGPLISSNTGAFKFSVPTTDGSRIVAGLSMERALLMTKKGVYITRGGEQGILTPSTVNPLKLSDEGCAEDIEPTMSGNRGFWINAARTKLMVAEFGADGNVAVAEASLLSNHFLKQGIRQIESIGGEDDCVYLVTVDGKLVRVTVGEEAFGFSLYETDGFVESVYRSTTSLTAPDGSGVISPEVLYAYVVRNRFRFKERIEVREDRYKDQELFSDSSQPFGTRLVLDPENLGAPGYIKQIGWTPWSEWILQDPFGLHINIEPPIAGSHSWEANQTIKIRANLDLLDVFQDQDFVIHFYYDETDEDGNYVLDENGRRRVKSLRYVIDQDTPAVLTGETVSAPWAYTALGYEFEGYFTSDVPPVLQDVRGQYTTDDYEFFLLQTRWLPAFQYLTAPTSDAIDISPLKCLYVASNGEPLAVTAEGEILSSPLNPYRQADNTSVEIDGSDYILEFDDYYAWGTVGIPYMSELETLDIEPGDNRTLSDAKKLLNKVGMGVIETRGGFFGVPGRQLSEMEEFVSRQDGDITQQTQNKNGHFETMIPSEWTEGGRISIKNVDPVPMTIVSIYPKGIAGE